MTVRFVRDRAVAGFTLVELLVVLAIIAIVPSLILPAVNQQRQERNQKAIPAAMQSIVTAQGTFQNQDLDGDGIADYGSFAELFNYGVLGNPLATGQAHGYNFSLTTLIVPFAGFQVVAVPAGSPAASLRFYVNQSGVIRFVQYGIPDASDPPLEEGDECMTPTTPQMQDTQDSIDNAASQAIVSLDAFGEGDVISQVVELLDDPANVEILLLGIDANGDGELTFDEALDADLLAIARQLSDNFPEYPSGPDIGLDSDITPLLSGFQAQVSNELELGTWIEEPMPSVPIASLSGDPSAYLLQLFVTVPALGAFAVGILVVLVAVVGSQGARRRLSAVLGR